ncbi:MAG: purine permease [Megasphaera sp.]|jgi:NCS2 family nucleobase:cation symporter-2|nr:purine permease [Megasphaera sp.]MCH4187325.1 purine permease [Megasphaera sp.]MCH4217507.1 purine permease [Megasphaera sp.]
MGKTSMTDARTAALFQLDGRPHFLAALPLALQHVVAMIVGCVTPAIIVAGAANIAQPDRIILIQASLLAAAFGTFLQLYPIGKKTGFHLGAGLPVIMGVSFAYVPTMQILAGQYGLAAILGAQVIGGICAVIFGLFIRKIRRFFPPLVAGTVVFTIGLSLYPIAINYMAGGMGQPTYGQWQNWVVALFTLGVVIFFNHFSKGILRLASILMGIVAGYALSLVLGMVDFSNVAGAGYFQLPGVLHFGMEFDPPACIALALLFVINSVQAIGDFSATTSGAMGRQPTADELHGAIVGLGATNILGAFFGFLPTASFSQNVGIVTTTKVINKATLALAGILILFAGLMPKFSALLTTIPYAVLGGATVSVFASIAMTGIKLALSDGASARDTAIIGLAVAMGMGLSAAPQTLYLFPDWVTTIFGKAPVVVASIIAISLNLIIPKRGK